MSDIKTQVCLNDIDFDQEGFVNIWEQNCDNFGKSSGRLTYINSVYIKCLFEIEKPNFKYLNNTCYFLYDKKKQTVLYDLEFKLTGLTRSLKYSNELNEILELYKTWIKSYNEDKDVIRIRPYPLYNTNYCWVKL